MENLYMKNTAHLYYIKDHLGSNRMVVKVNSGVQQVQHYYPFGLSFAEATNRSFQPYKYNGKELVSDEGLNWYDYLARVYDPALLIFTTMDPHAESYYSWSPYVHCLNNPIKHIDPDGRNPLVIGGVVIGAGELLLISTGIITTGILLHQTQNGNISIKPGIFSSFGKSSSTKDYSPEYGHQRSREKKEREVQNQREANVAKSIDTNISGEMSNGDPAPKRDLNDGGKKTKAAIVVSAVGAAAAGVASVVEGTQPQNEVKSKEKPKEQEIKPQQQLLPVFDWKQYVTP